MWTAVRLLAVCALGVSGLYALRSSLPTRQPAARVVAVLPANGGKFDSIAKPEAPLDVEEVGRKVVNVEAIRIEPIRLAALEAHDEALPAKPTRVTRYQRHIHHRHWHHGRRQRRR
jgi:hypothetical protein